MKKFFRVALVCALAGATLLYTGCTKDYSEDLSSLQKKVEDQGKSITSLEDQVAALLRAKTELENADAQAQTAIDSLKSRVSALEKEVDTLKSERTRLESLINKNAGDITKLQDSLKQVDSLIGVIQGQISGINGKIDTIEATIKTHKDSLAALDTELKTMAKKAYVDSEIERVMTEVAKKANSADVDSLVAKLREEIATKADKATVDSLVDDIKAKLADRYTKAEVDSLINDLKTTLQAAIDLKADKTYVDTELAKKADQSWVENQLKLYVTVENFNTVVAQFTGLITAANKEIQAIKTSLNDLYEFLGVIKDEESGKLKAEATGLIATMQATIDSLGNELFNTNTELGKVKTTAEAAKTEADAAVAFIGDLNEDGMTLAQYLDNTYYTKTEIDAFLAAVDKHIKDTLAHYLPLAKYVEDSAEIRKSINAIDTAIFDVIKSVNTKLLANDPSAPTFDEKKISDLAGAISALMDTKVDTMTFNDFVRKTEARLDQLEEDMAKVLKRVQSLVYVPDYDDNRITLNWAQMSAQNRFDTRDLPEGYNALPASFDTAAWNAFFKKLYANQSNLPIPTDAEFMQLLKDLLYSAMKFAGQISGEDYTSFDFDELYENSSGDHQAEFAKKPGFGMITPSEFAQLLMVSPDEAVWQLIMEVARYFFNFNKVQVRAFGDGLGGVPLAGNGLGFETPIVEPSHIKYRVYGVDAAATAQALAENYEDVFDFDVVRVKTRSNSDDVEIRITDAVADGDVIDFTVVPEGIPNRFWLYTWDIKNYGNPSLHALYLRDALLQAFGTGDVNIEVLAYLLKQWADNGGLDAATFMKIYAREHGLAADDQATGVDGAEGEIEVSSDFPAFSISLVLTQEDSSRFITSGYNNVVPAAVSDKIDLEIMRDNEPISWTVAQEVEIVYSNLTTHTVLDGTQLVFVKNGDELEGAELAAFLDAAGIGEDDIVVRFTSSREHLSTRAAALRYESTAKLFPNPTPDGAKKNVYFNNVADNDAPKADVNLTASCQEGVGSEEYVMINYFVGPAYVQAAALVKVIPDHLDVEVNFDDIVWSYDKEWMLYDSTTAPARKTLTDAQIDRDYYFQGADSLYFRDSVAATIVDETKVRKALTDKDIEYPADFKQATPDTALSTITFKFAQGDPETHTLHELIENVKANPEAEYFNIYPFFDKDGKLMAHIKNFPFFKTATGFNKKTAKGNVNPLTEISYSAVYYLCDSSFVANVSGKIVVKDRDRKPILINLPLNDTMKIAYNFQGSALDTLFTGEAVTTGINLFDLTDKNVKDEATTFAEHHLVPANVVDAFNNVFIKTWTGLDNPPYEGGNASAAVLYGDVEQFPGTVNYIFDSQGQGDPRAYAKNERIDSITMVTRDITNVNDELKESTKLIRNNTTAHINSTFDATETNVGFNTFVNFNSNDLANKEIIPNVDYDFYLTLWYGQDVRVAKRFEVQTEGVFDYERINEYVEYATKDTDEHKEGDSWTTVQPLWMPEGATVKPYTVPVKSYKANEVLFNQHFRVRNLQNGDRCTELDGELKADYSYLRRRFWLDSLIKKVTLINDPRTVAGGSLQDSTWAAGWSVKINNEVVNNTLRYEDNNILSYYSMVDETPVYGYLYIRNSRGSFIQLKTRFDEGVYTKVDDNDPYKEENYSKYVIQKFDPLNAPTRIGDEEPSVNVNNSIVTRISIYQFLSMKDKRGWEVIDSSPITEENVATYTGWIKGNNDNGFDASVTTDQVYDLHFVTAVKFPENLSEETASRFSFDPKTGILTYDNTLQTQLNKEIPVTLTICVDYPWNHFEKQVTVKFYNEAVNEIDRPQTTEPTTEP